MTRITLEEAQAMVAHVLAAAQRDGHRVAVAVVDDAGRLLAFARADGSPGYTADFAPSKARTAATFGNKTSFLERAWAERPVFAHSLQAQGHYFVGTGGAPVFKGDELVGGVGVSGGIDPPTEEAYAEAAAARVTV